MTKGYSLDERVPVIEVNAIKGWNEAGSWPVSKPGQFAPRAPQPA